MCVLYGEETSNLMRKDEYSIFEPCRHINLKIIVTLYKTKSVPMHA
jgi:hypothetical protein